MRMFAYSTNSRAKTKKNALHGVCKLHRRAQQIRVIKQLVNGFSFIFRKCSQCTKKFTAIDLKIAWQFSLQFDFKRIHKHRTQHTKYCINTFKMI